MDVPLRRQPERRRPQGNFCARLLPLHGGVGDESEMLAWTQSELDHSYPPAHALCQKKAGWG
jgi:hypothetical protein